MAVVKEIILNTVSDFVTSSEGVGCDLIVRTLMTLMMSHWVPDDDDDGDDDDDDDDVDDEPAMGPRRRLMQACWSTNTTG